MARKKKQLAYCYEFPRPAVSVDVVAVSKRGGELHLLLIRRRRDPFQNFWALPGGFLDMRETLEEAAARELFEETNCRPRSLQQIAAFSKVDRDPRGRVISVAFLAELSSRTKISAGDDAKDAAWHSINRLPPLAFDHAEILQHAAEFIGPVTFANESDNDERREFVKFLKRLLNRSCTVADWNKYVVAKGAQPEIESARKRLAKFALVMGQCSSAPQPPGIEVLANELLKTLTD